MVPGFWDVSQRQRIMSQQRATLDQTAVESLKLAGIYVMNSVVTFLSYRAEVCYSVPCVFIYLFIYSIELNITLQFSVLLLTYSMVQSPS